MISLQRLQLKNFKSTKKADIHFESSVILFSGKSGSGKSTVFDAIYLCWTGKKTSEKYIEYIKQGEENAEVLLNATLNDQSIYFEITLHQKNFTPFTRKITYKGVTYTNNEATSLIESLDVMFYFEILAMMQGIDNDITAMSAAKRAEYIQRLLNFSYEKEINIIKKDIEDTVSLKENTEQIKASNDTLISAGKKYIDNLTKLKLTESEYQDKKLQIKTLEHYIQDAISKNENYYNLSALSFKEFENKTNIEKQLRNVNHIIACYSNNVSSINDKKNNLAIIADTKKSLLADKELLSAKDFDIKNSIKNNKLLLDGIKDVEKTLYKEIEALRSYKESKDEKICPKCGQETSNFIDTKLNSIYGNITVEKLLATKTNEIKEIADKIKVYTDENTKLSKTLSDVSNELYLLNMKEKEYDVTYNNSLREISTLEKNTLSLQKYKEHEDEQSHLSNGLKESNDILNDYTTQLSSVFKKDVTEEQAHLDEIRKEVAEYEHTLDYNNKINNQETKKIIKFEKENEELLLKIANYNINIATYEDAMQIINKTLKNYLIVKTCNNLEVHINNIIHRIFDNYTIKLNQTSGGVRFYYTKDENLQDKDYNQWLSASMSSGFEKALLSVSFRLALCLLYNLPFILLDEIDSCADEDSGKLLYEYIFSLDCFNRIYIISHKDAIKSLLSDFSNVAIYNVENGNIVLETA